MDTNNELIDKNEIITLIIADMRSRKLIMGLEVTGLATDDFDTNLSELILLKMGIPQEYKIDIINWYEDAIYDLLDIDLNKFRKCQIFLATNLYDAIEKKKNKLNQNLVIKSNKEFSFLKWFLGKRFDN